MLQMKRFNRAAKEVQAIYGVSIRAAAVDLPPKAMAVAAMANHRTMITTNATPDRRIPKKSADQPTLSASCSPNQPSGARAESQPSRRHASHAETAIRRYSVVQTGPTTESGGVQIGIASVGYQSRTDVEVMAAPTAAAAKETATRATSHAAWRIGEGRAAGADGAVEEKTA